MRRHGTKETGFLPGDKPGFWIYRRVIPLISFMALALLLAAGLHRSQVQAALNPHGGYSSRTTLCSTCHRLTSFRKAALVKDTDASLCQTCHPTFKGHIPPDACTNCHDPHARTANLALIRPLVNQRQVRFISLTGKDSFVDGTSQQALCVVCHTKTRYHGATATQTHFEGQDCTRCHQHDIGFQPNPPCGSCHGLPPDSGAHNAHAKADRGPKLGAQCDACHWPVPTWVGHITGKVEFSDKKTLDKTGACNNCHSAVGAKNAKAQWSKGGRVACLDCHAASHPGNTQANDKGVDAPAVDQYWTTSGHGNTGRYQPSGNPGAKLVCETCHDPNSRHFSGRLGDSTRLRGEANALCEKCHVAGDGASVRVSTHGNRDYPGRGQSAFAELCTACHNPHGTSNLYMISSTVRGEPITFTALEGEDSYDESNPQGSNKDNLCATCHRKTAHNKVPNVEAQNPHNEWTNCTRCHPHNPDNNPATVDGFMVAAGCDVCHGQPPPPGAAGYPNFNEQRTPHRKHSGSSQNQYSYPCQKCHADFPAEHLTSPPTWQSVVFDDFNPGAGYNKTSFTCTNLYCHSNGNPAGGQLVYANPVWGEGKELGCDGCHGGVASLTTGSHAKHLIASYSDRGARSIGCYECHAQTARDDENNAIGDVNRHVNKAKEVAMDERDVMGRTGQPTFRTDGTCTNVYCHSNGVASRETPGQPLFSSPRWGDPASGACGTCHPIVPAAITSGRHPRHFELGFTSCDTCHSSYGSQYHVNGQVTFNDGQPLSATTACNACHSAEGPFNGVAEAKGKWYTAEALSCAGCHDGGTSVVQGVQAPNVMGDNSAYGYNVSGHGRPGLACETCHDLSAVHFDGKGPSYSAAQDNYTAGFRLRSGSLNVPLGQNETYARESFALCYLCHDERRVVGMPEEYSNALFSHSQPPPAGYPLRGPAVTRFRNELAAGFNFGNVPANVHWDHLDMVQVNWDSDRDGRMDSMPSCLTCHDPHGAKSFRGGTLYPAMTLADMAITYGEDGNGQYGQVGSADYQRRCNTCHPGSGQKYYRPHP